jgi:integrase/recombinase XerC
MPAKEVHAPVPAPVLAEWWEPFATYLAQERRYSRYTLRNYRQAFDDFYRWLGAAASTRSGRASCATS